MNLAEMFKKQQMQASSLAPMGMQQAQTVPGLPAMNPIQQTADQYMASPALGAPALAGGDPMMPFMSMMGHMSGMANKNQANAQQVVQQRMQMNQSSLDKMQQVAAMMRQRMGM